MFHVRDGVFFKQLDNGDVRLIVKESGHDNANVVKDIIIDIDSWCSVIATMSFYGEEDYGFYRAGLFHAGRKLDSTMPMKEKEPPATWKLK